MSKVYDITDVLGKFIGSVDWYGETNADNESYENLDELVEAITFLHYKLVRLVETGKANPGNYSAQKLGTKAKQILDSLGGES